MTVTTLASGSGGNSTLVSDRGTHILLDAGISARRITTSLRNLGVEPEQLDAIFVTHDHHDHINGLQVLTKKLRVPIYATEAACGALGEKLPGLRELLQPTPVGETVELDHLWVRSFATSHDAPGSAGYHVAGDGGTMVLCTDLGFVSEEVAAAVRDCDLLICEANHDADWVRTGPYPYHLKSRILGDRGHLSNEQGGRLARYAVEQGTATVILAHLSSENNTPEHAYQAVCRELRAGGIDPEQDISLTVAPRSECGPTFRVERAAAAGKGAGAC